MTTFPLYHLIVILEEYVMRTAFPAVWCCIETVILKEEYSLHAGIFENYEYVEGNTSSKEGRSRTFMIHHTQQRTSCT